MDRQSSWAPSTSLCQLNTPTCCCYAFGRNDFGQSGAPNVDKNDIVVPAHAIEGLRNAKVVFVTGQEGHSAFVTGVVSMLTSRQPEARATSLMM